MKIVSDKVNYGEKLENSRIRTETTDSIGSVLKAIGPGGRLSMGEFEMARRDTVDSLADELNFNPNDIVLGGIETL